jgi:hypothetical protein
MKVTSIGKNVLSLRQYYGSIAVGNDFLGSHVNCIHYARTQSTPPDSGRRSCPTLSPGPARTPGTRLFPEGYRVKAHDEVRGHPQCACHRDPTQRHGPYFEWTYKVNGKTVNVKLSPQTAPLYLAATKQNRKLKVALARMERLSRTVLARLAKQAENTD